MLNTISAVRFQGQGDALEERGKALENEYFRKKDRELIDKLKGDGPDATGQTDTLETGSAQKADDSPAKPAAASQPVRFPSLLEIVREAVRDFFAPLRRLFGSK